MALVNRNIVSLPHPSDPRQSVGAVGGRSKALVIGLTVALLFALVGTASALPDQPGPTTIDGNVVERAPAPMTRDATELVAEGFFEALEDGSFSSYLAIDAVLTRGACGEPAVGATEVAAAISGVCQGAFEGTLTVNDAIVGAGFATVDGTVFATQVSPFKGYDPSNRTLVLPYTAYFELFGGQIVRATLDISMDTIVHQLNARDVPPWNPGLPGQAY